MRNWGTAELGNWGSMVLNHFLFPRTVLVSTAPTSIVERSLFIVERQTSNVDSLATSKQRTPNSKTRPNSLPHLAHPLSPPTHSLIHTRPNERKRGDTTTASAAFISSISPISYLMTHTTRHRHRRGRGQREKGKRKKREKAKSKSKSKRRPRARRDVPRKRSDPA